MSCRITQVWISRGQMGLWMSDSLRWKKKKHTTYVVFFFFSAYIMIFRTLMDYTGLQLKKLFAMVNFHDYKIWLWNFN